MLLGSNFPAVYLLKYTGNDVFIWRCSLSSVISKRDSLYRFCAHLVWLRLGGEEVTTFSTRPLAVNGIWCYTLTSVYQWRAFLPEPLTILSIWREKKTNLYWHDSTFCYPAVPDNLKEMAKNSKPLIEISNSGNSWTIKTTVSDKVKDTSFNIGEEFDSQSLTGQALKVKLYVAFFNLFQFMPSDRMNEWMLSASLCPHANPSIYPSDRPPAGLSVRPPVGLSARPPVRPSLGLSLAFTYTCPDFVLSIKHIIVNAILITILL